MPRARSHPRGRPRGRRPDDGASAVEYAVLLAGAVLGIFAVIVGLKSSFGAAFSDASDNQAVVSDGSTVAPSNGPTSTLPPPATPVVTAVPGNGFADISWSPISGATSYVVTIGPNGSCTVTGATARCTGLTNGTTYAVGVVARAPSGNSGTGTVSVVPRTVPGAPTNVVATPGNGTVSLTWSAPSSDGGSPITNYIVTNSPSGGTCAVSGTTATCTGLTNNTTYTFTVVATNAAGNGAGATATAKPTSAISVPRGGSNWTENYTGIVVGNPTCSITTTPSGQNVGSCSFTNANPDQLVFNPRSSATVGTNVTIVWTICTAQNRQGQCTASTTVTRDFVIAN